MELHLEKVKTRPYSMLIQKSNGSSAFDEQKVKNIAIEYRFFPTLIRATCLLINLYFGVQAVINDIAGRGVRLMEEYKDVLTDDEEQGK